MPRIAQNSLTISPLADGRFFLSGSINAKQVRLKFLSIDEAETKKLELENSAAKDAIFEASRPEPQFTRLNPDQLRIAENIFAEFGHLPMPLPDYIRAGVGVIGTVMKALEDSPENGTGAVTEWRDFISDEMKLQPASVTRNLQAVRWLLRDNPGFKFVSDITPASVEAACSLSKVNAADKEKGASLYTKITRIWALNSFFKFCLKKKYLLKSPLEIDEDEMKKLGKLAKKQKADPVVMDAAQSDALLQAAIKHDQRYIPYVILCLWCFARTAEVRRLTPARVKLNGNIPFIEPKGHKLGTKDYRQTTVPANVVDLLRECIDTGLWAKDTTPFFTVNSFRALRVKAGLIKLGDTDNKGHRKIVGGVWDASIMRHTGISMLYQKIATQQGDKFNKDEAIKELNRQADNSEDVAFEHYINLQGSEEAVKFYKCTGTLKNDVAQFVAQSVA